MRYGYIIILFMLLSATISNISVGNESSIFAMSNASRKIKTQSTYDWVFMVYLDGDNNLESAAIDDFKEMSSVGSTSNVSIITLFDRWSGIGGEGSDDESYGNWTNTLLFFIDNGEEPYNSTADADWGERNMGDPQTLYDFVSYIFENYPATHYALILWDHGGGVYGSAIDEDNGGDLLSPSELLSALKNIYEDYGRKIDLLGMDMCLMGLIETLYGLWDYVDYIVFSEELEPEDGWPYDDILNYLVNNPSVSPSNLARKIVEYYINSYYNSNVTLSAIDLNIAKQAIPKLNRLVGYLLRNYGALKSAIDYSLANAEAFGVAYNYSYQKDLLHFLELLNNSITNSELQVLIDSAYQAINDSIIANGHFDGHPNAHGLAAVFNGSSLRIYSYQQIPYSYEQQWVNFVYKVNGYSAGLWFYDIQLNGQDSDGNGFLDTHVNLTVDLDTDVTAKNVSVQVFAWDGDNLLFLGSSPYFIVSGAQSTDAITFPIRLPPQGTYQLKIRIVDNSSSPNIIKDYGLYADEDLVDVKLESNDVYPPTIGIISPANGTTIKGLTVTIQINVTDDTGIDKIEVYANETLMKSISGETSQITLTMDSYGLYVIKLVAYDLSGKSSQVTLIVKLVEESQQTGGTGGGTGNIGGQLPIDMRMIAIAIVTLLILIAIILVLKRK